MMKPCFPMILASLLALVIASASPSAWERTDLPNTRVAAQAINGLGLDLLREGTASGANALLSPYSIQTALAMAYVGSEGETRREMAAVLHYPDNDSALNEGLRELRLACAEVADETAALAEEIQKHGGSSDPVELTTANRLFGQHGYAFRSAFLALLAKTYDAPLQIVDYVNDAPGARDQINRWVEKRTRRKIQDLLPPDSLDDLTRLVLVNAVYLKAPWQERFMTHSTQPREFTIADGVTIEVPTMVSRNRLGYQREDGFQVITVPYSGGQLHCLILLPDDADGLPRLESSLTPEHLLAATQLARQDVRLYLPKFRIEPPAMPLGRPLRALGMNTAFDVPRRSANFDRMAPRRLPDNYLFISEVFHKTFLELDEAGTEAAAATAVLMARPTSIVGGQVPKPIEVKVDRPFLFAIQHRPSGSCLFLGRVTDPR